MRAWSTTRSNRHRDRKLVRSSRQSRISRYLTGSFPLTIETPSAIALQVLNAVFYGLDLNDLQTYRERVNAITPDDIQRVAREYLRPDRLSIVLVGDASVFAKQLAGVGFDQYERIALSDLDLGSVDLKRHGPPTNRFEMSVTGPVRKVYADGSVNRRQSGGWANAAGPEAIAGRALYEGKRDLKKAQAAADQALKKA